MRASLHFAKMVLSGNHICGVEVGIATGDNMRNILNEWDIEFLTGVDIDSNAIEESRKNLSHYSNHALILGDSSEVAKQFEDESLDFVYIDDDHDLHGVIKSLEAWYPKVKKGGIFAGHDYYVLNNGEEGVHLAVTWFFQYHGLKLYTADIDWWTIKPNG